MSIVNRSPERDNIAFSILLVGKPSSLLRAIRFRLEMDHFKVQTLQGEIISPTWPTEETPDLIVMTSHASRQEDARTLLYLLRSHASWKGIPFILLGDDVAEDYSDLVDLLAPGDTVVIPSDSAALMRAVRQQVTRTRCRMLPSLPDCGVPGCASVRCARAG